MITNLKVTGMTCNNCRKHVDSALRGVAGVTAVEIDLPTGAAKVVHDATVPSLVAAVEEAGYQATETSSI